MSRILVTGGAGYVGSHIVRRLADEGAEVVVVDDLSEGHRAAVGDARLVVADFADPTILDRELSGGAVDFVIHMAAFAEVGQSVKDPATYYRNNVSRSLALLEAAVRHEVRGIVFSSTAAVYGEPDEIPIDEEHPQRPTNPYGETKLAFEKALDWHRRAHGIRWVALRYFNAAGAHPDGSIGEDHAVESHLIPNVIRATVPGTRPLTIFGDDYPTPDGTCVRDYVHVCDLAQAHVLAVAAMRSGDVEGKAFNLGNGEGFSVREVRDAVARVANAEPATETGPRRPGDPATLVASSDRARRELGWKPEFPDLETIVRTAWDWHRSHPRGFDDR
jgi:UDP-glucose 4-epimerase